MAWNRDDRERTPAGIGRRGRGRAATAALVAAIAGPCGALLAGAPADPAAAAELRPNIVFITTDDQRIDQFSRQTMPETFETIVDPGTTFSTALAAPPLCCPYRAGFLTGQYPHNHGVFVNDYAFLREPENVLPEWLRRAGYRTGMVGKYLNLIERPDPSATAPGWDEWFSFLWVGTGMSDLTVNDNGVLKDSEGYITDLLTERAVSFINDSAADDDPFFLWVPQISPHIRQEAVTEQCAPRMAQPTLEDYESFAGPRFGQIRRPSFNEGDVSDKQPPVSGRARLTVEDRRRIRRAWRCAVTSLYSVDRGVGEIVGALAAAGELERTIVAFGSDNGFMYGEHRLPGGKANHFEEAFVVPFAIRVPEQVLGAEPRRRVNRTVTQLDLTATLLELAGAEPCVAEGICRRPDGRSFAPLLRGESAWGPLRPIGYALERECKRRFGLRNGRFTYVQRPAARCPGGPRRELYDLRSDPYQLHNVARHRPARVRSLRRRALRLRRCSGAPERDPQLPGVPYCR